MLLPVSAPTKLRLTAQIAALAIGLLGVACLPETMTGPGGVPLALPQTSFYLRTVDGAGLPLALPGGAVLTYSAITADTAVRPGNEIWWSEGVSRSNGASASSTLHYGTGKGYVVGADLAGGQIAALVWPNRDAAARADSSRWSADTVIVYRTGGVPFAVGAGHRLVYTRMVPSDTL